MRSCGLKAVRGNPAGDHPGQGKGQPDAVPSCNAIVGIELADARQMVVVTDPESKVLARRAFQPGESC
jgi:hypothetical protein